MEAECSGDAYNLEAWARWAHNTLQFTLSSSCANSNHPLAMLPSMDPSVVGGKSPSFLPSELPVSLGFSDHFNMGISSLTNREGLKSLSPHFCHVHWLENTVCSWAGTWEEYPSSVLSAQEQCTQRNDMEIDAGRLVPAVINE